MVTRCIENANDDNISSEKDYQKYFSSSLKAKYLLVSCLNWFDVATMELQLMLLELTIVESGICNRTEYIVGKDKNHQTGATNVQYVP